MVKGQTVENEYITDNIMESAFLTFKGFIYKVHKEEVEETKKTKVYFIFTDIKLIIPSLLDDFWKGSKELRLLDTFRAVKRTAVFDGYQRNFYRKNGE